MASESMKSMAENYVQLFMTVARINRMFDRLRENDPTLRDLMSDVLEFLDTQVPSPFALLDKLIDSSWSDDEIEPNLLKLKTNFSSLSQEEKLEIVQTIVKMYSDFGYVNQYRITWLEQLRDSIKNDNVQKIQQKLLKFLDSLVKINYFGFTIIPNDFKSTKWYSVGCVNCGDVSINLPDFLKFGPNAKTHSWFCPKCLSLYNSEMQQIMDLCCQLEIAPDKYLKNALQKLDRYEMILNLTLYQYIDYFIERIEKSPKSLDDPERVWVCFDK